MSDPKTRALELVTELHSCSYASLPAGAINSDADRIGNALRLAITQIPTTRWQPMETAPAYPEAHEFLVWHASHGCAYIVEWYSAQLLQDDCGNPMDLAACSHWAPLTPPKQELPEDAGQLETMPHLFLNEARQAGEHKATHTWVPIAECGELADGEYLTLNTPAICDGSGPFKWHRRIEGGRFANGVIAVLSPHLGPIPEAP